MSAAAFAYSSTATFTKCTVFLNMVIFNDFETDGASYTEITDTTIDNRGMEEHVSEQGEDNDNEQDEDAEEM